MKKNIITSLFAVAALSLASCSYLECALDSNPKECAANKAINSAVEYLAEANQINTQEKADSFASQWSSIQSSIETAQTLGIDLPSSTKKTYNDTLTRMQKHNYFGSSALQSAMSTANLLK